MAGVRRFLVLLVILASPACGSDPEYDKEVAAAEAVQRRIQRERKGLELCETKCQQLADRNLERCKGPSQKDCEGAVQAVYWQCVKPCQRAFTSEPASSSDAPGPAAKPAPSAP